MIFKLSEPENKTQYARGYVVRAFGNLLQVKFEGTIRQGEVASVCIGDEQLKAEVIEIVGDEAKIQVFEDTRSVMLRTPVIFSGELLEAELGPGLLASIFDGLQNPLEQVAERAGHFLTRGIYLNALDRQKLWAYKPVAHEGACVERGDTIGTTLEGRFPHFIMVPFSLYGTYEVVWTIPPGNYTIDTVVAQIRDQNGSLISLTMLQKWPIKFPLFQGEKINPKQMLETGLRIIDTQFPLVKGGTFCTPGPFGAGKTMLQQHLSKYSSVDIVILVACGERAGEVVEVLQDFPRLQDPYSGGSLMDRTVMICNTSSMPVAARESSVYMGATIAEYYRQMGLDVLLLADSTSRWAQAMREMSGRLEEIPGEEAFPAYLASRIAEFYERSGTLALKQGQCGSLTIGGSVSPAGGNFEEPVTQATLNVVGAFLGLSRERSDSRRYPAIDPLMSWSKYVAVVTDGLENRVEKWGTFVKQAEQLLRKGIEIGKRMEVVGEEGVSTADMQLYLKAELYDFAYLQQNAFDREDRYCSLKRQLDLFQLLNFIFSSSFRLSSHDSAREFFLNIQSKIKNINTLPFPSEAYQKAYAIIMECLEQNA